MANVTLKQIRAFITAVDCGNFSRAADKFCLSQSAFTRLIQELESELDTILFRRSNRGIEVSDAGKMFLTSARKLLNYYTLAIDRVDSNNLAKVGSLQLGISSAMSSVILPHLVESFNAEYPNVSIQVQNGSSAQILNDVLNGKAEIGVVSMMGIPSGIKAIPVLRAPLGLLVSKDYGGPGKISDLNDLAELKLVRHGEGNGLDQLISTYFPDLEKYFDSTIIASDLTAVLALVHSGVAATILSGISASHPWAQTLNFIPLPTEVFREVHVISRVDTKESPWHRRFASILQHAIMKGKWHSSVNLIETKARAQACG